MEDEPPSDDTVTPVKVVPTVAVEKRVHVMTEELTTTGVSEQIDVDTVAPVKKFEPWIDSVIEAVLNVHPVSEVDDADVQDDAVTLEIVGADAYVS